jgi:NAD(P)H-dependent flavin oxidoreductase YrpB (nitropropane dioxygenase family)
MTAEAETLSTRLTQMLGCQHPVIQTAMGWVATPELVIASTHAGAFGFLAAAVMQVPECEAAISTIKNAGEQPFGVNLHSFQVGAERIIDLCIDHEVKAISYGRAPSAAIISKVKAKNILCVPTIGAAKHAKKAVDMGADILVCQGSEGGGHTGNTPTWLLLAQVLDLDLGVPVIACGGFRDGRGLAAALTFGADGIAMGTRFLLTQESPTPENTKQAYLQAKVTEIPVSTSLDGMPQRMVMNDRLSKLESAGSLSLLAQALSNGWRFKKQMDSSYAEVLKTAWDMARNSELSLAQTLMAANAPMIIKQAMVDGHPQQGVLPSGQVAGLIDDLPSCSELMEKMMQDAIDAAAGLKQPNETTRSPPGASYAL